MNFSIIIPSRDENNLVPCIEAVRKHEPGVRIIVVDDGLDLSFLPKPGWQPPVSIIGDRKPFVFARNCNLGLVAAGQDDVILLNDDALLETPGGFSELSRLAEYPDIGVIAPVTNVTGQPLQKPQGKGLRQVPHIAFICVYIPRRTIDRLGMLDERYCLDYGVEDRDYCEAVNRAGLKVCVYDHVFVDHSKLHSTFRGDPKTPRPFTRNYELFKKKWGLK